MDGKKLNRDLFKDEKFQDEIMGLLHQLNSQSKKDFDIILDAVTEINNLRSKVAELEEKLRSK